MKRRSITVTGENVQIDAVQLKPLPEINGQLNEDVSSGLLYLHKGSGTKVQTSELGPNGFLAAHRAEGTACIQVLSGSGVTGLVDPLGNVTCEISLAAGDLVTFEENMPLHFYRAGEDGLTYIAVNIPAGNQK